MRQIIHDIKTSEVQSFNILSNGVLLSSFSLGKALATKPAY